MTIASSGVTAQEYIVARDLTITPSASSPGSWLISWGEGSDRETLQTRSGRIAGALVTLPRRITELELAQRLAGEDLSPDSARHFAQYLVLNQALTTDGGESSEAEKRWDKMNLHDALVYHRATRNTMWRHEYPANAKVMTWNNYDQPIVDNAPRPVVKFPEGPDAVLLPEPDEASLRVDGFDVLARRRTHRSFRNTRITLNQTAELLHWSLRPIIEGVSRRYFSTLSCADGYREATAPHPVSAYLFFDPAKIPSGLGPHVMYRYNPHKHALIPIASTPGEYFKFSKLLWGQDFADEAPLMIVLGINWDQFMWKYRLSYGYRLAHFDLGAYMQTALVAATALGLRTFMTPAVDDERFERLLGTDESVFAPTYTLFVGASPSKG